MFGKRNIVVPMSNIKYQRSASAKFHIGALYVLSIFFGFEMGNTTYGILKMVYYIYNLIYINF